MFINNHLSLSRNTVKKYISLFELLGLSFEAIDVKTDAKLEVLFSQNTVGTIGPRLQKLNDLFPQMERELKKVTVQHMWERYIAIHPVGFKSSQFRHHFKNID